MSTLHFHQTTTLTPEQYIAGLTDFGPGRSKLFGNSADEYLKVHSEGSHDADVTEGSGGIWERLHYDWSDPNCVVLTTTDSNVWGGASGHTYTFTCCPTARPILTWSSYAKARTSRGGYSASCSGPSAGAFWKGRLKTPSRPSRSGTARLERPAHPEPGSPHCGSRAISTTPSHGATEAIDTIVQ